MTTEWAPVSQPSVEPVPQPRDKTLPREGPLSGAALFGIATIIGLLAVGLGIYAFASRDTRTRTVTIAVARPAPPAWRRALTLVAARTTERIPLAHSVGRLVLAVAPDGNALLVVHDLGPAPAGKTYQAWVIPPGKTAPVSAAVFRGHDPVVSLRQAVQRGAVVAVTLERAGGVATPSHAPRLVATRL